ncbi:hypothetical protein [Anderseniella sp. Alg231-50]|uniref:hypothetical protein n=1 Tax=Anderseniella sp. Alg231-50 TaxID=1922226 RepID=UPI00307C3C57
MKKLTATSIMALALAMSAQSASAADYDAQIQQLVVSGIVDSWNGYTFIGNQGGANADVDPDSYFSSGLSGRLSLPLGENLTIQMDGDLEYTDNAFDEDGDDAFDYSGQLGAHLTYRDPGMGAFGAFGAFGAGRGDDQRNDFVAVGGEAQLYLNDLTFYVQAGYLDGYVQDADREDAFHDAVFVRGVARWFMTPDSRLQAQVAYVDGHQDTGDSYEMDIVEWGVRYDMILAGLPVIGDTPVYVGYRGARFDNEGAGPGADDGQYTEHTIMVGTTYAFGGNSMREFDRVGATLDLPNFGRWVASGQSLD